jgi:two-component system, OmpR family, response regulator VicR
MTILIADDEETLLLGLRKSLEQEQYSVLTATDGVTCLRIIETRRVDLLILDIMMPGLDGISVCKRIRETSGVPIIMLTAKDDVVDRILGLEYGADDYVTKPFHTRELLTRIKAVLRRAEGVKPGSEAVIIGPLALNRATRTVILRGNAIDLTPREFDLLYLLMENPGMVFTRERLFDQLWRDEFVDRRTIDVHVGRLREKIEDDPSQPRFVKTKWGVGYYVADHSDEA